ncbi:GNAT family N-acetyltransferase [Mesobacillus jeotgali]|uniref:GNAT family N-acetyltransferase n=1 Tax=Mesobacillus jeotgali TaxID=129985 RepID=UPI0009A5AE53|nr:GNAT family N-acetyltransferase [Mesobacillus jeotgali]
MIIRTAEEQDAELFARLIQEVESTSNYMMFGPGERQFNPEAQRKMINVLTAETNSNIFLAVTGSEFAGYLIAKGGNAKRNKHAAYLVIGVKEAFRGEGVGTKLFSELFEWVSLIGLHRLELTVITQNQAGLALYKNMGFEIEGTKKHSLCIDGQYHDEYYMSKII